ncbi:hypothetical protein ARMGADRAFT_1026424 [Armillaria gallica]|uniref:Uncharacterized protein n=1 Tax=Armillaria gallica TaxID=47427 RepID=A0A2H3ED72_ARMGA|nr:hypothetical protein ARMGADRAFT_1026424 [Armillaria gallica]
MPNNSSGMFSSFCSAQHEIENTFRQPSCAGPNRSDMEAETLPNVSLQRSQGHGSNIYPFCTCPKSNSKFGRLLSSMFIWRNQGWAQLFSEYVRNSAHMQHPLGLHKAFKYEASPLSLLVYLASTSPPLAVADVFNCSLELDISSSTWSGYNGFGLVTETLGCGPGFFSLIRLSNSDHEDDGKVTVHDGVLNFVSGGTRSRQHWVILLSAESIRVPGLWIFGTRQEMASVVFTSEPAGMTYCLDSVELGLGRGWYLVKKPQQRLISVAPIDLWRRAVCVQTDCKATATCALSMWENALRGRVAWEDEGRLRQLHSAVKVLVSCSKKRTEKWYWWMVLSGAGAVVHPQDVQVKLDSDRSTGERRQQEEKWRGVTVGSAWAKYGQDMTQQRVSTGQKLSGKSGSVVTGKRSEHKLIL